jgi:hypothetical protein
LYQGIDKKKTCSKLNLNTRVSIWILHEKDSSISERRRSCWLLRRYWVVLFDDIKY